VPGPATDREAQLTAVFSGTGVPNSAVCTLGLLSNDEPWDQDSLIAVANALKSVHLAASCGETVLARVELKVGPNDAGPTLAHTINTPGGVGNGGAPPNVSLLVTKDLAGVSARFAGRMYWPGVHEASIEPSGSIVGAYLSSVQAAFTGFKSALDGLSILPIVFSRSTASPSTWNTITGFRVQPTVATQRQRLRR